MCVCFTRTSTFQWLSWQPMMIELCFKFINPWPVSNESQCITRIYLPWQKLFGKFWWPKSPIRLIGQHLTNQNSLSFWKSWGRPAWLAQSFITSTCKSWHLPYERVATLLTYGRSSLQAQAKFMVSNHQLPWTIMNYHVNHVLLNDTMVIDHGPGQW